MCRRRPVLQSTDCIRGNIGFTEGLHAWEIEWKREQRGTHATIGVSTKDSPLQSPTYQSLVGHNKRSWGWELCRSIVLHDCYHEPSRDYPECSNLYVENMLSQADCNKLLDKDAGTVAFMVDDI